MAHSFTMMYIFGAQIELTRNFTVAIKMFRVWKPHEYLHFVHISIICEWIFISFKIFSTHFCSSWLLKCEFIFNVQNFISLTIKRFFIFIEKGKKQFVFRVSALRHHLERSWKFVWFEVKNASNLSVVHALATHAHTPQWVCNDGKMDPHKMKFSFYISSFALLFFR